MRHILIVDLTPFFGGGQKFVENVYNNTLHPSDYYFIVSCEELFRRIETDKKVFIPSGTGLLKVTKIINSYIERTGIVNVLLNGNRPIYLAPFIRAKNKIAYRHTSNNAFNGIKKVFGSLLLNLCFFWCSKIVILYDKAKDEIFLKHKVEVIHNGIFLNKKAVAFSPTRDEVVLTCITRLDPDKGIEWLVDEFQSAFKERNDVILKIAGDGVLRSLLENKLKKTKSRIELLGFVKDIDDLLLNTDIFILPSRYESFPLSVLEAMSHGLPIIATDTGGVSEMVLDEQNGYLIKFGNKNILGGKMQILEMNRDLREKMGKNSTHRVSMFSINNCVNRIEKLLI